MKQITLYVSPDLENRVIDTLEKAGVEGFLRVGGATGNKFLGPGQIPRTVTWQAEALVVPAATDEQVDAIFRELEQYANACETHPCLRMVAVDVDRVH